MAQTVLPCETYDFPAILEMFSYFMFSWEEKEGGYVDGCKHRCFPLERGSSCFAFLRGAFRCVLQGLCFLIRQEAQ